MRELFNALSHLGDGAFIIDDQHKVIFWNEAAQRILHYSAEEALGLYCYEILGGRDEQGKTLCQRYCWVAMNAQQAEAVPSIDISAKTAEGERTWINVTTFAVSKAGLGSGRMIVHIFRDANVKKRNEQLVDEFRNMVHRVNRDVISPPHSDPAKPVDSQQQVKDLTPRQSEVLRLLTHGLGTAEIADKLTISQSTARNHIQAILNKLGVHSRLEAVAFAYQNRLLEDHKTR